MTDIILGVGVAAFLLYTGFNIAYLVSMKRTSDRLGVFLQNTEGNLNRTMEGLAGTLENMQKISSNVSAVSDDVRQISQSVAGLERSIRDSLAQLRDRLGSTAEANIAGLKAGISTGVATLAKNLQDGRRNEHERGSCKD